MLFNLPHKYLKNAHIGTKPLLNAATKTEDKRRLRENLLNVELVWQIEGFDIPNYYSDDYNCQVIMFLCVELNNIKNSEYIGKILQKAIKELCIIKFYSKDKYCFCFAKKRLNKLNSNEIVIEDLYVTDLLSNDLSNDENERINKYLDFNNIKNKSDKYNFYNEVLMRTFICFNQRLFKKIDAFFNSDIWFKTQLVNDSYKNLRYLKELKFQASKAAEIAKRSDINSKIKTLIKDLEAKLCN